MSTPATTPGPPTGDPDVAATPDLSGPAPPPDQGLEETYRTLWPPLVRLGHLLCGSQALGEEVAQEAFLGLVRRTHPVDEPAAYLRRSVVNLSITARRRQGREQRYVAALREDVQLPPEVDDMWQLLVKLPDRQRAVLVLRFYEDLSEAAIAEVLGCRPGTVKSLSARGFARLRREMTT